MAPTIPSAPTPRHAFNSAEEFNAASEALNQGLRQQMIMRHGSDESLDVKTVMPFVVYAAFTIELYLKCLIMIETGQQARGHNLLTLYARLNQPTKDKLEEYTLNPETGKSLIAITRTANGLYTIMSATPHYNLPQDVNSVLVEGQNVFAQFRYLYESSGHIPENTGHNMDTLRWGLRRLIIELYPDWEPLRELLEAVGPDVKGPVLLNTPEGEIHKRLIVNYEMGALSMTYVCAKCNYHQYVQIDIRQIQPLMAGHIRMPYDRSYKCANCTCLITGIPVPELISKEGNSLFPVFYLKD